MPTNDDHQKPSKLYTFLGYGLLIAFGLAAQWYGDAVEKKTCDQAGQHTPCVDIPVVAVY